MAVDLISDGKRELHRGSSASAAHPDQKESDVLWILALAHILAGKPVSIPDRGGQALFRDKRYGAGATVSETKAKIASAREITSTAIATA